MISANSERFTGALPRDAIKIADVKCPDSGETDAFNLNNSDVLGPEDEVKFVSSTRHHYEFEREFSPHHRLPERVREVIFSPVFPDPAGTWPGHDPRQLAEWVLAEGSQVRLGLQLHKFIWNAAMHGV